jgi:nicotinamide phosphoribosyltransferase
LHELGHLPIRIKAIPEGERIPIRVPSFTIQNTDPKFPWVTNYLESDISSNYWKSLTTATRAYMFRKLLERWAVETGTPPSFVSFQGHDFSYRGMSCTEDAVLSGAAHLTSFMGTDTIPAIDYLEDYYNATGPIGMSVPATEHSVMCMGGEEDEIKTFEMLMDKYPKGILSIVSDTWDLWAVLTQYAPKLKAKIEARQALGPVAPKVVFRPDSGDPVKIIVGDHTARHELPARKGAVQCLWDIFGGTVQRGRNGFGGEYKQLGPVGTIYGDSINYERAEKILFGLAQNGFASGNVVFGIGSYTYQYVTRDSLGTAMKATYGVVNGEPRVLFKAPKTDDGVKNSARGLLRVNKNASGEYYLQELCTPEEERGGELRVVFENSVMYNEQTLDDIQQRLHGRSLLEMLMAA